MYLEPFLNLLEIFITFYERLKFSKMGCSPLYIVLYNGGLYGQFHFTYEMFDIFYLFWKPWVHGHAQEVFPGFLVTIRMIRKLQNVQKLGIWRIWGILMVIFTLQPHI